MTIGLRKTLARLLALGLVSALAACGGSSPPPPPTGPTSTQPPAASRATVTMTVANPTVRLSPRGGFNFRLEFDVTVRESAGVGANLNFLRTDFLDAGGGFLERQEAGSNLLNRLPASGTLAGHVTTDFNTSRVAVAVVTLNLTDDRGNTQEAQVRILFS